MSRSFGCDRSARPIATRWRSPPERLRGDRSSSGVTPRRSTTSSKAIVARDTPSLRRGAPNIRLRRTDEVREQARLLEDVAERPLVGRQKGSVPVLPHFAVDLAEPVVEAQKTGNAAQDRRLAATGRTEYRGHAFRPGGEAGVERELADRSLEFREYCVFRGHARARETRFSIRIIDSMTAKAKTTMPPARMLASRHCIVST